ncbi:metallophosphoesterase family protein [Cupriavidus sp. D39]|uniref:metallophosphoesterase family protein n=1 Tax=Cupriavidus sp. D39 TaxID=2997877 RepID=UPI0022716599|nr:metallophosphoesterase [Cupriavidus sp. D39]MCY0853990.1 metallophosphoesterase [Cupriavidus sp. D39]
MTLLLQISDPHFGTELPDVVEALVRLVHDAAPELVVLSGDITQRARRKQFLAARAFVDRLHVAATLIIPGNHDIPLFNLGSRLFRPYANYRQAFGDELEPIFESDQWLVITLNTTRFYRHKNGEVSAEQVERVAARLEQAAETQLRVVVTHQPVAVTSVHDKTNLLHGCAAAVRRWSQAGADLILGGHIHLPFVTALHERFATLPRKVWAVQAGTAVSSRVRFEAGNSVNLIRGVSSANRRRSALVERWDYVDGQHRFQRVDVIELHFDASLERRLRDGTNSAR